MPHPLCHILRTRVDHIRGAQARRDVELVAAHIDGDDLRRAERACDLDHVQSHAAGGNDGHALASAQIGRVADSPECREHRTSHDARLEKGQRRRQRKDIRRGDHGKFSEPGHRVHRQLRSIRTPQPRGAVVQRAAKAVHPEEVFAQVVAPDAAGLAGAARHDERRCDARAGGWAADTRAERFHRTGDFVTEHGGNRKRHFGFDDVQVGVTDTARAYTNEHFTGIWHGHWNCFDSKRARCRFEDGRAHHLHGGRL